MAVERERRGARPPPSLYALDASRPTRGCRTRARGEHPRLQLAGVARVRQATSGEQRRGARTRSDVGAHRLRGHGAHPTRALRRRTRVAATRHAGPVRRAPGIVTRNVTRRRLPRPPTALVVIVAAGFVLRLAWCIYAARDPQGLHDPLLYRALSDAVAHGHGYDYPPLFNGP